MPKRLLKKCLLGLVGAVVIALGITLFNTTQATTTFFYAVTELGSLGGRESVAYDINDLGQAVGYSYASSGEMRSVLWHNDTLIHWRLIGHLNYASAINNSGQVASNSAPHSHTAGRCPSLWQNGNLASYIGKCGGSSYVNAINNVGQVAGWGVEPPFVWQNGLMTYLSTLSSNRQSGGAFGINDRGQVVGFAATKSENGSHAVLWQNGTIIDLGTLPGGRYSQALSINKAGKVVGWSDTSSGSKHAVLWQKRQIIDLGTLSGNATRATDINNRGTVVGFSFIVNNYREIPQHAFVWKNGRMIDLNKLLPANSGWELTSANAINNRGQIVGSGQNNGQTKAFLLTPVRVTN